ncbi:hypothetical protein AGLY_000698 [Aphis glycines]|uniref:Uncharacterized protein n=1 Tax=Aphis glycines TaxID=307491 RepID=A0A6G0U7Q0_APHGL|nr:hypothetical protein AGLY_000698 [Aphis glycines]
MSVKFKIITCRNNASISNFWVVSDGKVNILGQLLVGQNSFQKNRKKQSFRLNRILYMVVTQKLITVYLTSIKFFKKLENLIQGFSKVVLIRLKFTFLRCKSKSRKFTSNLKLKTLTILRENSKRQYRKNVMIVTTTLSSNDFKYLLLFKISKSTILFLLAFEVQILTKNLWPTIIIKELESTSRRNLKHADKSSPFRIVIRFSYTMIPIIGFKFNTPVIYNSSC